MRCETKCNNISDHQIRMEIKDESECHSHSQSETDLYIKVRESLKLSFNVLNHFDKEFVLFSEIIDDGEINVFYNEMKNSLF